jgi:hypothetical protein
MAAKWERGEIVGGGKLTVYTSEQAPGYRIEKWAEGTWAVMLLRGSDPAGLPYLGFTRHSLTAAKLGVQEELDEVPLDQRKRY